MSVKCQTNNQKYINEEFNKMQLNLGKHSTVKNVWPLIPYHKSDDINIWSNHFACYFYKETKTEIAWEHGVKNNLV
jgi:hypothetical protein